MFKRFRIREVMRLIESGRVNEAAAVFLRYGLGDSPNSASLRRRLVERLLAQARQSERDADFEAAWRALNDVGRLALPGEQQMVTRQRQSLVESTLTAARQAIAQGHTDNADRIAGLLQRQHILDSRADQIHWLAERMRRATELAETGNWRDAQAILTEVEQRHPELDWVQSKSMALAARTKRSKSVSRELQAALLKSQWSIAQKKSSELLGLAPHHATATEVLKHCLHKKNQPGTSTQVELSALSDTDASRVHVDSVSDGPSSRLPAMGRQILWVDGVGGFLLCDARATIGRAVVDSKVEIPIIGDLHRHHLRIAGSQGDYLLTPFAETEIDSVQIRRPELIRSGQTISLARHVHIRFERPNPLSLTARLQITSRHRTQPWSDAILLVGDTVVVGPGRDCHIVCPHLQSSFVLRRAGNRWYCRFSGNIEIDQRVFQGDAALEAGKRVVVGDCSLTLESLGLEESIAV